MRGGRFQRNSESSLSPWLPLSTSAVLGSTAHDFGTVRRVINPFENFGDGFVFQHDVESIAETAVVRSALWRHQCINRSFKVDDSLCDTEYFCVH